MASPYYARREESTHYRRGLTAFTIASFVLHVGAFVFLAFSGTFLSSSDSDAVPFGSPFVTVKAVDPSELARSMKEALPAAEPGAKETPEDLEPPPPTPPPAAEEVDTGAKVTVPDKKVEEERKKKEEEAKKAIEAQKKKDQEEKAKKEKDKKDQADARKRFDEIRRKQREDYRQQALNDGIIDGQGEKPVGRGSPYGTGAPGGDATACAIEMDMYFGRLRDRFWNNWVYPQRPEDLSVTLYVEIARDGAIQDARIHVLSGKPLFDKAAIDTLTKMNPLEPPPSCNKEDSIKRKWKIVPEDTG